MKSPQPNFSHYPLAWLAASFTLGIIFASGFVLQIPILLAVVIAASILALLLGKYAEVFLAVAFCAAGALVYTVSIVSVRTDRIRTIYDSQEIESGEPVEIEGMLTGKPEPTVDGYILRLRAAKLTHNGVEQKVSGEVRLFATVQNEQIAAEYLAMDLRYGTLVR
ncbi:MAG: DUF4131 domain-containing protein, partial [Candidatus Binatia bacterium]